ncbi:MAG: T9SS type A sorting domain-containing protein [Bacteroidetes bacterium]|nr:T9SS type A sorting domain-containing protein [Bacteroidota bacterium]
MKKHLLSFLFIAISFVAFSQITITSTVTNVSCFGGSNGSATITASGGTGAYTYTWLPTGTASPNVLTNVAAGQYTVIVEDAVANTNSLVINIGQPTQLTAIAVAQSSAACWCNGSASVTVSGGNPPYMYSWNTPFSGNMPQVTNLCPGITQVNITDANGCVATTSVGINAPPPINITSTVTNASCQNSCNGSASVSVTGGSGGNTYQWIGPGIASGSTTSNPMGMCPGTYSVIVTDAMGCQAAAVMNLSIIIGTPLPNATITSTSYNEMCHLTGDGAIDVTITGSNPGPFTYQWSNGANTQDISNVISNIYFLSITDGSANCITIKDTISSIGINCGTINGNVYVDNNSDCLKNSGDNDYQNAIVLINPGNRIGYTNTNGSYTINSLPYGTYSVTLITSTNTPIFPTCTTTLNATVNSGNQNSINNNLSVGFNSITNPDLNVSAYSNGVVPGFVCYVNYNLGNLNNVSATGLFKAVLPSAFIPNITTGNPNTYTISGDTVIWNFNNLTYTGGTNYFTISFTTPLTTPLGSIFTTCMWAQPTVTDLNYVNNTTCYQRMVTGSYDPNDKTVSPVGIGANGDISATETDLTYLIRFQNTGNGPAVNIFIKDTLSPNVDINTFEMLGSSHNYMIDVLQGNVLRWKFNNIMLPDSNSNEPGSHGYIQYRIKRTNNNTPGTQIKNTAYIYFDFNEPVVTNTAINTIETITGIKSSSVNNDEWNIYPNPSTGALYIVNSSSVKEESQIQVINSIGQTVLEETITSNYKNVDLSKLNNGVYFVKIVSDKQSVIKRVVLKR